MSDFNTAIGLGSTNNQNLDNWQARAVANLSTGAGSVSLGSMRGREVTYLNAGQFVSGSNTYNGFARSYQTSFGSLSWNQNLFGAQIERIWTRYVDGVLTSTQILVSGTLAQSYWNNVWINGVVRNSTTDCSSFNSGSGGYTWWTLTAVDIANATGYQIVFTP